ncbi:MAG: IS1096 element passenger TnpR family protein [Bacteroidales bacterium]
MIYRFVLLSDEVDNFGREISIDQEATFEELQDAILESVNYNKGEMTSFFLCEDNWEKGKEVTMMEMDTDSSEDSWVMSETKLVDLIEEEGQKLIFVFDMMVDRCFFMELEEINSGTLAKAYCSKSKGEAPEQFVSFESFEKETNSFIDEDLYDDDQFDISELDEEGFDITDGNPYEN